MRIQFRVSGFKFRVKTLAADFRGEIRMNVIKSSKHVPFSVKRLRC
jgi:hypothetical protein